MKRIPLGIACVLIVIATSVAYWQVRHFDFTSYDDEDYITRNPMVRQGLTSDSVQWALTTTYFSYWHPLTWLSHILDVEFFGLDAGKHHLVNVLIHILATLALFGGLARLTKQPECSLVVAALFALHPLHVESVAWIAERKDVLSTLFWFLVMWAYAVYAERPRWWRYAGTLLLFGLGLMSKPMLVTVPCVLLLLDFWPLRRLRLVPDTGAWWPAGGPRAWWRGIVERSPVHPGKLVMEKVPFLVMAIASSAVTFIGVYSTNRVLSMDSVPLGFRLANVPVSYVRYLGKMILPENMVVLYPMPERWETWQIVGSSLLVLMISLVAVALIRRAPYVLVGWLWYVGTLVPTIGLIPVGFQSIADRYTYVPLVGVFILVVWTVADISMTWPYRKRLLAAATTVVMLFLTLGTWLQTRHWRDTKTLFTRAVTASTDNALAHYNLGLTYQLEGRLGEAAKNYQAAIRIQPGDMKPRNNLGYLYNQLGMFEESTNVLMEVLRRAPDHVDARLNLGVALTFLGQYDEAVTQYEAILQRQPSSAEAYFQMGRTLERQGAAADAMKCYREALGLRTEFTEALLRLAWMAAAHPDESVRDPVEALTHAQMLCELTHNKSIRALLALAVAQAANHDFASARATARQASALAEEIGSKSTPSQQAAILSHLEEGKAYVDEGLSTGAIF